MSISGVVKKTLPLYNLLSQKISGRTMRAFLFFLFFSFLFADPGVLPVTENDPSTLVDGVSVITGDFYTYQEDYVVQGAEPIALRRSYLSNNPEMREYPHLIASYLCESNIFLLQEPNGTPLFYSESPKRLARPIGENFYAKKEGSVFYRALEYIQQTKGVSNTAKGNPSAKSRLERQSIVFDRGKDPKGKSFTLFAANGTVRRYVNFEGQKKETFQFGKRYLVYLYRLEKESLPNGHAVHYEWSHNNELKSIRTTNLANTKVFAEARFPSLDLNHFPNEFSIRGSDGREARYFYRNFFEIRKELSLVISPERADFFFSYNPDDRKHPLLTQTALPEGRKFVLHYQDFPARVCQIDTPLGENDEMAPWRTFSYFPTKNRTDSRDALGNRSSFFWNNDLRIVRIERFLGENTPFCKETFVWEGQSLRAKVLFDEEGAPLFARTFLYDASGNILEETSFGNLTGNGSLFSLDEKGMPRGGETALTINRYDARDLLVYRKEASGLVTEYEYHDPIELPKAKFLSFQGKIFERIFYEYDEDWLLVKESTDDGSSKNPKELSDVHFRRIETTLRRQEAPFLGMPEWIFETYWDGNCEVLLQKTQLFYGEGAHVTEKKIYDADGQYAYTLFYRYDEKGRLLEETDPIGQTTRSFYDSVGNLTRQCEGNGVRELHFFYNLSNALTKIEKIGVDGLTDSTLYDYDKLLHLKRKTDNRGNATHYTYNLCGSCTETTLPSQVTLQGSIFIPKLFSAYDVKGNETLHTDSSGNTTITTYTAWNKPARILHPDGASETFLYSPDGRLLIHTDPLGVQTHTERDCFGRIRKKTLLSPGGELLAEETFTYKGLLLETHIDAEGLLTRHTYDGAGRKIGETTGERTILFSYDSLGRLKTKVEHDVITTYFYDTPLARIAEERKTDREGTLFFWKKYSYDAAGNLSTETVEVCGQKATTTHRYDSFDRCIQTTDPFRKQETFFYDETTNSLQQRVERKTSTDPLGLQTIVTYDALGRVASCEKKKECTLHEQQTFYDGEGKKTAIREVVYDQEHFARTIEHAFSYDSMGRLKIFSEGNGRRITHYEYTPRGELSHLYKPDGIALFYEHDYAGFLTHLFSSDQSVNHTLTVNRRGELVSFDGISRILNAYGEVLREDFPEALSITKTYDPRGRAKTFSIADYQIFYEYTPTDLKSVSLLGHTHLYLDYDLSGNLVRQKHIGSAGISSYAYDLCQRPRSFTTPFFSQEIREIDPVGNILCMQISGESYRYTYDPLYQLLSESGPIPHNYSYDSLFNRTAKDGAAHAVDGLNCLVSDFSHDLNGNPTHIGNAHLTYDALDRLIQIETPQETYTYTYDYQNRRLTETSSNGIHFFLYDGQDEIGSYDGHSLKTLRILGRKKTAEIGAAVAHILDGRLFIPFHDLQGNIATLAPCDGARPLHYRYSAFGEESTSNSENPWRFSSKRTDPTGLVYYGRRYYLPSWGRWLTPDPLGLSAGPNLYAFVYNAPLTHIDLYGLEANAWWKETFEKTKKTSTLFWNTHGRRIQGGVRALGGLAEAGIGAGMTLYSGGISAPLGWAFLTHGLDHFFTGMQSALSNRSHGSATFQTLHKAGVPPQIANFLDEGFSMASGFMGPAAMHVYRISNFPNFSLPKKLGLPISRSAFEIALKGGKHSGFLKNNLPRSYEELQKGIFSFEKQIALHKEKVLFPSKHIKNWSYLDIRQRQALVREKWPSDINRLKEQKEILEDILNKNHRN